MSFPFADLLGDFATAAATIAAQLTAPKNPTAPVPHISMRSKHFLYAVLIAHGMPNEEACEQVGCSPRTAEGWRKKLCAEAELYFGRPVTYPIIAMDVVEVEIARFQGRTPKTLLLNRPQN